MAAPQVPGVSPASILAAALTGGTGPLTLGVFSAVGSPSLPSLISEVIWLPETATFDCDFDIVGTLISQGWATGNVTAVTGAYTCLSTDAVILANAAGGAFTVTLPDATQPGFFTGQRFQILKTDSSANVVTVAASAGQTINGASTQSLTGQYAATAVIFDGLHWWVWAGTGAGGSPSGAAGGGLAGNYPNPTIAAPLTLSASVNANAGLVSLTNTRSTGTLPVEYTANSAADGTFGVLVSGDSNARWKFDSNGKHQWGSGSGTQDTDLYRSGVGVLATDAAFTVGTGLSVNGNVVTGTMPADLGYLAWTADPSLAGGTGAVLPQSAGVIELIKIPLWGQSLSTTGVALHLSTLGASLTAAENWVYLFTSAGTFVAATADQTSAWNTGGSTGPLFTSWASGPFALSGTWCWIGLVWNGTTAPSFLRASNNTAADANGRLTAANSRYGTVGSAHTSNAPGNFTPSTISQNSPTFWAAIY